MKLKRVFLALNPPSSVQEEVYACYARQLDARYFKIVPVQNLHLTLSFLGYLGEEKIAEVVESLQPLKEQESFDVRIGEPGTFRQQIVWVGIGQGKERVRELVEEVNGCLGLQESRFHAHLTLARARKQAPATAMRAAQQLKGVEITTPWRVAHLDLMESQLGGKEPVYRVLQSIPLR